MILNITYDQATNTLPAGFVSTINAVVNFFQSSFTDSVTVNIDVGYGEVHGQGLSQPEFGAGSSAFGDAPNSTLLSAGVLGASITYLSSFSYTATRNALISDATSADDASAINSLPATDPTGNGHYWVATAEAKALALLPASIAIDGYVGFSNTYSFDYDNSNGVSGGSYDFYGVVAHEFSEVMGRQLLVGDSIGGLSPSYEPLD